MQNLKIKVNNEAESREAQELFFELGFTWSGGSKDMFDFAMPEYIVNWNNGYITVGDHSDGSRKEITLPELRTMVNQDQDEPFLTPECTLNDQYAEIEQVRQAIKVKSGSDSDHMTDAMAFGLIGMGAEKQTIEQTLAERQAQYGCFEDVARTTGKIMEALAEVRVNGLDDLPYPHRMALYMIASKMARIVNGDFNSIDGWHDIAGYAKLVEDTI